MKQSLIKCCMSCSRSGVMWKKIGLVLRLIESINRMNYHLYSPEETVQRARSKIGERQYNLLFNNCEHFAVWCKTGLSESRQINELIRMITKCDNGFLREIPYLAWSDPERSHLMNLSLIVFPEQPMGITATGLFIPSGKGPVAGLFTYGVKSYIILEYGEGRGPAHPAMVICICQIITLKNQIFRMGMWAPAAAPIQRERILWWA